MSTATWIAQRARETARASRSNAEPGDLVAEPIARAFERFADEIDAELARIDAERRDGSRP